MRTGKPDIAWDDQESKDGLVSALVTDALALLAAVDPETLDGKAAEAYALLALVAGQDVEPAEDSNGTDGRWRIARKVAPDRLISTVDPDTRHAHKTQSRQQDGFKAHIVIEPDTGLITAAKLTKAGIFEVILGVSGVAKLMRFIPRSVMVGLVNALAILIFMSQVPELIGVPWLVYPLAALALLIVFGLPKLTKAVPAPLVAIVALTLITVLASVVVPTVGDKGELPDSLPSLFVPNVPFSLETLQIIFPFALAMAFVGLLESLMTAKLVDDITDTRSHKTREAWGRGVANIVTGFTGGMGGCAMIGQTMINVKASGARTRISTFLAGVFLLTLVVALGDLVSVIPMVALVAVMIFVFWATFDWHSIHPRTLKMMPKSETLVMVATVIVIVATHNLAIGVGVGVLLAMVLFTRRVAHFVTVERTITTTDGHETAIYVVKGELFFDSSNDFYTQFEYALDPEHVVIDMHASHLWDASTIAALDAITEKYHNHGKT